MSEPITTIAEALATIPPGGALVIPLAGLPAGTQISITIVVGPPEPAAMLEPAPAPDGPARRYAVGSR